MLLEIVTTKPLLLYIPPIHIYSRNPWFNTETPAESFEVFEGVWFFTDQLKYKTHGTSCLGFQKSWLLTLADSVRTYIYVLIIAVNKKYAPKEILFLFLTFCSYFNAFYFYASRLGTSSWYNCSSTFAFHSIAEPYQCVVNKVCSCPCSKRICLQLPFVRFCHHGIVVCLQLPFVRFCHTTELLCVRSYRYCPTMELLCVCSFLGRCYWVLCWIFITNFQLTFAK